MALVSRAAVALDARAVRARGLALWVTESDSELNARTTLTGRKRIGLGGLGLGFPVRPLGVDPSDDGGVA